MTEGAERRRWKHLAGANPYVLANEGDPGLPVFEDVRVDDHDGAGNGDRGNGGDAGVSTESLVRSSAVVGIGTALSRVTGLVRTVALAYALGTTLLADSYNLANTTP